MPMVTMPTHDTVWRDRGGDDGSCRAFCGMALGGPREIARLRVLRAPRDGELGLLCGSTVVFGTDVPWFLVLLPYSCICGC